MTEVMRQAREIVRSHATQRDKDCNVPQKLDSWLRCDI